MGLFKRHITEKPEKRELSEKPEFFKPVDRYAQIGCSSNIRNELDKFTPQLNEWIDNLEYINKTAPELFTTPADKPSVTI